MQMPELDELYADIILDHYKSPRNRGALPDPALNAEGFNPFCGDRVVLSMDLDAEGRIAQVGFEGEGCSISQASASIMTGLLKDKTIEEASALNVQFREIMASELAAASGATLSHAEAVVDSRYGYLRDGGDAFALKKRTVKYRVRRELRRHARRLMDALRGDRILQRHRLSMTDPLCQGEACQLALELMLKYPHGIENESAAAA